MKTKLKERNEENGVARIPATAPKGQIGIQYICGTWIWKVNGIWHLKSKESWHAFAKLATNWLIYVPMHAVQY